MLSVLGAAVFLSRCTAVAIDSSTSTAYGDTENAIHRIRLFMGTQDDRRIKRVPPRYKKPVTRVTKIMIRMMITIGGSSMDFATPNVLVNGGPRLRVM
jgi:hypothetical protein